MIPVAILCGGKATRLAPLTDHVPKYLIDVAGKPFAFWQLELLKRSGYTHIVLLTGHFGEQIKDIVGDGQHLGVHVFYSDDGPTSLGTGGAIQKALPLLGPEFFVLYGDSYLECDYQRIERDFRFAKHYDALLTVWKGVDYGLRAYRRYPPINAFFYEMSQPWKEIGSHHGLEELRQALSR